ncbi:MAG: hypothetical protein AAGJ87_07385, partial [Pseudomonadota bacterium]
MRAMERKLSAFQFMIVALIGVTMLMLAAIAVPHDRYYRYQKYDSVTTQKADWIHERLRMDETPVDIALVGTSRMGGGVSSPEVERLYCAATGRRIHVANIALPKTGRNMHYVLTKEALRTKAPTLIVIELNEVESRRPHDGFVFLADAVDVLTAPRAINFNYISDLIRLPGRQAQLFFETTFRRPALRTSFDPDAYAGAHLDRTHAVRLINGGVINRDIVRPADDLDRLYQERLSRQKPMFMMPDALRDFEYRFSRLYLRKIETIAAREDAAVEYVYLPAYRGPLSFPRALKSTLRIRSGVLAPGADIIDDPDFW